jgi:hypothetical protein
VVLLSQPRRLPLLSAYLAGGMVISIGLGLAIVAALEDSHALESNTAGLSWGADLAVGGLALLAAVALATRADERLRVRHRARHPPRRREEGREPWSQRILARGSVPIVFAAGMAINLPGAAYLIGLKDIAADDHATGDVVLLIVVFNLIMFLLAEIPLLGLLFAPERTDALVARMDHWLSANGRRIAVVLCAGLGIFLVARGIAHATGSEST